MNASQTLRPAWTPLTIGLMVLGFIVWWPLGLAMLAYIVWGNRLPGCVREVKSKIQANIQANIQASARSFEAGRTGNAAFDDYRRTELKRLEEERRRLDDEVREFEAFLQSLRRAKDQEEFDRFMAERRKAGAAKRAPDANAPDANAPDAHAADA